MTTLSLLALLTTAPPAPTDLATFEREVRRPMTAARAEEWAKALGANESGANESGANARVEMPTQDGTVRLGRAAFLLRAPNARRAEVLLPRPVIADDPTPPAPADRVALRRLPNGLWGAVVPMRDGEAHRYRYAADDRELGDARTFEAYRMPPELTPDPAVPHGELREMPLHTSTVYPGTTRPWWVYLPAKPAPEGGYNLIVFQDGQWARGWAVTCLDNMIAAGTLPPTVAVFVKPGSHAEKDGGKDGDDRAREYDVMSDEYARMLLDELLPGVGKLAPITGDPSRRAIAGESSGGICAFTAAWERPESFGLVMSWIGSYVNIAALFDKPGGQNYPARIRRTDRKPIRIVLQDGAQDLDNDWGNWPLANRAMLAALRYKAYNVKWLFGQGFHSGAHGRSTAPDSLQWLFRSGRYAR